MIWINGDLCLIYVYVILFFICYCYLFIWFSIFQKNGGFGQLEILYIKIVVKLKKNKINI